MSSGNRLTKKIVMFKLRILLAVLSVALILLACGCVQKGEDSKTISNQLPSQYIILNESGRFSKYLRNFTEASQGKTFLIINMTIENHGYKAFEASPNYFEAIIDNVSYPYDNVTFLAKSLLNSSTIFDGGKLQGHLVYKIPQNETAYTFRYVGPEDYYLIHNHLSKTKLHHRR